MKYHPQWDETRARLTRLWHHERQDRPCISITAPNGTPWTPTVKPETPEAFWLDPDAVLDRLKGILNTTWFGGECMPGQLMMEGWVLAQGYVPNFAWNTIWFHETETDFSAPPRLRFDPEGEWERKFTKLYRAKLALAGWDDFCVGAPMGLPTNDLLSMVMGTESFLLALIDEPEWMKNAIEQGARERVRTKKYYRDLAAETQNPELFNSLAGWMPFWAPEAYTLFQSDVSCMLSPAMFDEFIVPDIRISTQGGPMWYHLDGGDAKQHLPTLLSLPELRVLQYVPAPCEPGNGPEHLAFYRQVQEAGRIVHIQVPKRHIEALTKALDPDLLMLHTDCASVEEGEALLRDAVRWCGRR